MKLSGIESRERWRIVWSDEVGGGGGDGDEDEEVFCRLRRSRGIWFLKERTRSELKWDTARRLTSLGNSASVLLLFLFYLFSLLSLRCGVVSYSSIWCFSLFVPKVKVCLRCRGADPSCPHPAAIRSDLYFQAWEILIGNILKLAHNPFIFLINNLTFLGYIKLIFTI